MSIPVTEDTSNDELSFVERIEQKVYRFLNNTGATVNQGDFLIIYGFFGVVLQEAANGEYFDMRVDDEMTVHANDLRTGADTFGTVGQTVYWNNEQQEFDDTGFGVAIGKLAVAKDSDGLIKIWVTSKGVPLGDQESLIVYTIAADATAGIDVDLGYNFEVIDAIVNPTAVGTEGSVQIQDSAGSEITNIMPIDNAAPREWIEHAIASDYSTPVDVDFGFNFTLHDVLVHPDATSAGGTVQLADSGSNAITDAMVAAVVDVPARPSLLDGANGYNVITDGIIEFTTNGAADRATVHMLVEPTLADRIVKPLSISAANSEVSDGIVKFVTGQTADRAVVFLKVKAV